MPERKRNMLLAGAAGTVALFGAAAIVWLFVLRFRAGAPYPAYSSFQTEPVGTRALFDTLRLLPGVDVRRRFSWTAPEPDSGENSPALVLVLGYSGGPSLTDLEGFLQETDFASEAAHGGRVLLAFRADVPGRARESAREKKKSGPEAEKASGKQGKAAQKKNGPEAAPEKSRHEDEEESARKSCGPGCAAAAVRVKKRVLRGITIETKRPRGALPLGERRYVVRLSPAPGLPERLPWFGPAYFAIDPEVAGLWTVLYGWDDRRPVLIRRRFGAGEILLATDSYLFSNEALARNRCSDFLLWLLDGFHRVIFDEVHFGITEHPNLMAFLRRYGLIPFVAGLLIAGLLYVWQAVSRPTPPPPAEEEPGADPDEPVEGRVPGGALAGLMRRHLSPLEALEQCVREYLAAPPRGRRLPPATVEAMLARVREAREGRVSPAACYNEIRELLRERKA